MNVWELRTATGVWKPIGLNAWFENMKRYTRRPFSRPPEHFFPIPRGGEGQIPRYQSVSRMYSPIFSNAAMVQKSIVHRCSGGQPQADPHLIHSARMLTAAGATALVLRAATALAGLTGGVAGALVAALIVGPRHGPILRRHRHRGRAGRVKRSEAGARRGTATSSLDGAGCKAAVRLR